MVLGVSLVTTGVALLGGVGILPSAADDKGSGNDAQASVASADIGDDTQQEYDRDAGQDAALADSVPDAEPTPDRGPEGPSIDDIDETAVPLDSGEGRRVVFSEDRQRVWLVDEKERVERTYLVSGSVTDNLDPGTFEVYSRSEDAVGIDDSGTMKWFVRFTQGDTGAAIGFHDIPVDDGDQVQTKSQLGTPQSHGCIRQKEKDAKALWAFAPLGTTVVVV